jgi:hypothetical protein
MNTQQVTQEDILKLINTLAIQVRDDLMEHEVFEDDSDILEAIKSIIRIAQTPEREYPFSEGDTYFTISFDEIIESVWDEQSKEIHLIDDKEYFSNLEDAVKHFRKHSKYNPKISLL